MSDLRIMYQVVAPVHGPDGLSVLYGPGELHEPGSLPEGVGYRAVVADDVARAIAPAYAQPAQAAPPASAPVAAEAKTETAAPAAAEAAPVKAAAGSGTGRK